MINKQFNYIPSFLIHLPFLALPSNTPKDIALRVFINMNTNTKPLSLYDVIVAEIESVKGVSLHDLQNTLNEKHPKIVAKTLRSNNPILANIILHI